MPLKEKYVHQIDGYECSCHNNYWKAVDADWIDNSPVCLKYNK
jgi:hypothetical protein